jgi:hypothetical protein
MPQTDTLSLQEIKRETEQARAGLTDTVEQLKTSAGNSAEGLDPTRTRGDQPCRVISSTTGLIPQI